MRAIYFMDDTNEEQTEQMERLSYRLEEGGIDPRFIKLVTPTNIPPFEDKYDVLFFDWGGMSMGNSMMEYFSRRLLDMADSNPSRIFCMTSSFTAEAVKDAREDMGADMPANVFLTVEDAIEPLKAFLAAPPKRKK